MKASEADVSEAERIAVSRTLLRLSGRPDTNAVERTNPIPAGAGGELAKVRSSRSENPGVSGPDRSENTDDDGIRLPEVPEKWRH